MKTVVLNGYANTLTSTKFFLLFKKIQKHNNTIILMEIAIESSQQWAIKML